MLPGRFGAPKISETSCENRSKQASLADSTEIGTDYRRRESGGQWPRLPSSKGERAPHRARCHLVTRKPCSAADGLPILVGSKLV